MTEVEIFYYEQIKFLKTERTNFQEFCRVRDSPE
jgi:hypothetical protein